MCGLLKRIAIDFLREDRLNEVVKEAGLPECHELKKGQILTCRDCGLELEVIKECSECGPESESCAHLECAFKCCGKEMQITD